MGWLIALLLLLLLVLLAAVLASRIRIELRFRRARNDDRLEVDVKAIFGLFHYRYEVSKIDYRGMLGGVRLYEGKNGINPAQEKASANIEDLGKRDVEWGNSMLKSFRKNFRDYNGWLKDTAARVTCTGFRWSTSVGTGNPANTAIVVGAGWGIKSFLLGRMTEWMTFKNEPILLVAPCYNRTAFSTDMEVLLQMRAAALAISGWKLLRRMRSLGHAKRAFMSIRREPQMR